MSQKNIFEVVIPKDTIITINNLRFVLAEDTRANHPGTVTHDQAAEYCYMAGVPCDLSHTEEDADGNKIYVAYGNDGQRLESSTPFAKAVARPVATGGGPYLEDIEQGLPRQTHEAEVAAAIEELAPTPEPVTAQVMVTETPVVEPTDAEKEAAEKKATEKAKAEKAKADKGK